jgi:tRNA-dihydrouridine synthase B
MKIGKLDIGRKAIFAPMAEVTDTPFRQICRENGAGLTFTQMVSAKGVVENSFITLKALVFHQSEKPIGIQFLGSDPVYLERAVNEVKSFKPDLVDLNCGCSVAQVCKYGLGASLLDDSKLLENLVKKMVKAAGDIPVSVKIRLGRNRKKINVIQNAKIIEDNGASFITVHGRTREDSYSDSADWEWIKKVKESVSIPVVGNGSLFSPSDCKRMIDETGCDSVLIARGAIGNPFIFSRFNTLMETGYDPGEPDIEKVAETAIKHLHLQVKDSGEILGVKKIRKNLIWYFRFYQGISYFINKIFTLEKVEEIEEFISEHAKKIKSNNFPEEDLNKIDKSFKDRVLFWIIDNNYQEAVNQ